MKWIDTKAVAERYGVPEETVRYWRHIGYGPTPIKLGRHVRYREADWEAFEARLTAEAEQGAGAA